MIQNIFLIIALLFLTPQKNVFSSPPNFNDSCSTFEVTKLEDLEITANTGEKPQSKLWHHDGNWWAVLPNAAGTKLWKLQDTKWEETLHLSDSTHIAADIRAIGNVTHILLYQGRHSELISVEYDENNKKYMLWSIRPHTVKIHLERASETATIDIDLSDRMWLASDDETEILIRWSDPPYVNWSKPQSLASGVSKDDICAIITFPNGSIGVFWSNQITQRFGFRLHAMNTNPDIWSVDEIPASGSAISWKLGMADDHINLAVASNGTLYAVVKTSYDTDGYPLVALLIRRPSGKWDRLYNVDDEGSRGIILLNEEDDYLMIVYSSYRDRKIVCRKSETKQISFGERQTLMNSIDEIRRINNVTSTKQNCSEEMVIIASEPGIARGVCVKLHK